MSGARTVVGIDPSGDRLSLVAVRTGLGGTSLAAPPTTSSLRGDRGAARMEEADAALSDFVARHGLAGSPARLCVPSRHVYTTRADFPPLKDRDMREALALELERLFPLPASRLRFGWRRIPGPKGGKSVLLTVAAASSDYLAQWEECVSRAGLVLSGAIPTGWALASAFQRIGRAEAASGGPAVLLRSAGGEAECTVLSGGEPVFCASRACAPDAMPALAAALIEEGLPETAVPAEVFAPEAWRGEELFRAAGDRLSWRVNAGFEAMARAALSPGPQAGDPWEVLGAYGAAVAERTVDLLAPAPAGNGIPWAGAAAGVLGAAAVLLAVAWPAVVAWKADAELTRLDGRIATLRPAATRVQDALDRRAATDAKRALLREAVAGRGEPIEILRELTERLPTGTWLTGLRVENRKVEIDGLSPAASDIFPVLSRDGRFRGVEFASPIVRQADNLERFQIRAEYVPAPRPGPVAGGGR